MKRRMNPVMNTRFKNVGFWIGIVGIVLTAAGIDPASITSWDILFTNIVEVVKNPYMLVTIIMAVVGVFTDPTTPGIKDKKVSK
jgi:phi LC3 family holin